VIGTEFSVRLAEILLHAAEGRLSSHVGLYTDIRLFQITSWSDISREWMCVQCADAGIARGDTHVFCEWKRRELGERRALGGNVIVGWALLLLLLDYMSS
jgi:hypothetical protein